MEVCGQLQLPATLPLEKQAPYPLDKRLDGSQSRSGHYEEKSLTLAKSRTLIVRPSSPYASCYTDRAIPVLDERVCGLH
jgi:hypothetical protein